MPIQRRKKQALISFVSIFAILVLDQSLKSLVRLKLAVGESIPLINNIFHITYVSNTGAAFGLFKNSAVIFIIISVVAIVFIAGLILRSIKRAEFMADPIFDSGLILIISGAIGNLIDRLKFGYVIDFIDVRIWPVFNIADTSITIGTLLLILSYVCQKRPA
ncbi:MAG: signal peptidase II [Candidatus Omnitrophica bacterium]|nr:signal peptidase II [Candidatus Omnitrophota bacterium]MBU4457864.1 signal peptidase II [Candidatus Omnitrophota bacterium]